MFKRWCKRFLKAVAVLAVLLVLFLIVERVRGQIALARYKKALIAKGEKLTARELQASNATGENGAPAVLEAIGRLQAGAVLPDNYPPRMKMTPAGRAVVCFREPNWVEHGKTNQWEQLASDLKNNEVTLAEIRIGLEKPALNNGVDFSQGMKMQFPQLSPPKKATHWFGSGSQLALHLGDPHAAMPELLAEVRLPRLLAEDRLLISELVRIAIGAVAKLDTWEALQAGGWTDKDLERLQDAWRETEFAASMARSLEGERLFSDIASEMMRDSNEYTIACLSWVEGFSKLTQPFDVGAEEHTVWDQVTGFLKKQVYCRVWRFAWSHQDQRRSLDTMQRLITATRATTTNKSAEALQGLIAQIESEVYSRNYYDRLRFPNAESLTITASSVSKAMRAETDRSLTICAIALKRYALRHGKLPASLDVLAPEFLPAVPVDYMDGKPLRYRLNADGSFLLYSVGENLTDDGGDTSALPDYTTSRNPWFKKDYIWPAPATPEEVEAYREEARKN